MGLPLFYPFGNFYLAGISTFQSLTQNRHAVHVSGKVSEFPISRTSA